MYMVPVTPRNEMECVKCLLTMLFTLSILVLVLGCWLS
nr:MAG TPA: hypothetical protein [Microviridae sp.]